MEEPEGRRSGGELYEPVYTMADADAAIQRFAPCDYEQTIDLCQGIKFVSTIWDIFLDPPALKCG